MYNDPRLAEVHFKNIRSYICKRWRITDNKIESGTFRSSFGDIPYLRVYGINNAPLFDLNFYRDGVELKSLTQDLNRIPKPSILAVQALCERLISYLI